MRKTGLICTHFEQQIATNIYDSISESGTFDLEFDLTENVTISVSGDVLLSGYYEAETDYGYTFCDRLSITNLDVTEYDHDGSIVDTHIPININVIESLVLDQFDKPIINLRMLAYEC